MHACFDALMTVFKGHLVAAACVELGIDNPDSDFTSNCSVSVCDVATKIVEKFTIVSEAVSGLPLPDCQDRVYNYARVLCHTASLAMEFTDAWSEGDGPRVLRCWKVLLLHFYAGRRTKYALEALRLQIQLATLSPDLVHQLTWDRFVSSHGGKGRNIPCDLHNEHVNKLFKEIIKNMGANFTEVASTRVARAVTTIEQVVELFDTETGIHPQTSTHSRKSDDEDVKKVVKALVEQKILTVQSTPRSHTAFSNMTANPLQSLNRHKLEEWIAVKLKLFAKKCVRHHESDDEESSDCSQHDEDSM